MATTFTKLKDGTWGLRGPGLVAGEKVWVDKKGCDRAVPKYVGRVLWTDGSLCIATIGSAPPKAKPACKPAPEPDQGPCFNDAQPDDDASLNWEM